MLFTAPLGTIIGTDAECDLKEAISVFTCKDKDVEVFLKRKAIDFEKRDKSRTYIVFDNDAFMSGIMSILAYFTLSLKSLEFGDTVSKGKIKDIDGFSKEVKGVAIPLVGQFGKDENAAKRISGKDLLDHCMGKIYEVQSLIGGRYVLIECHDIDKIVNFYRDSEFDRLQFDKSDNYLQMVRRL